MKAGVIGLGDMGSGLAKNLIANGFETSGFDLSETRMADFSAMGGITCAGPAEVGRHADAARGICGTWSLGRHFRWI